VPTGRTSEDRLVEAGEVSPPGVTSAR
jgi:hypothetical protein